VSDVPETWVHCKLSRSMERNDTDRLGNSNDFVLSSRCVGTTSTKTIRCKARTGPLQVTSISPRRHSSQTNQLQWEHGAPPRRARSRSRRTDRGWFRSEPSRSRTMPGRRTSRLPEPGARPSAVVDQLEFRDIWRWAVESCQDGDRDDRLNVALSVTSITVIGPFAVASNTCGASVAAGASCQVGVTFIPAALARPRAFSRLADSAMTSPQTVSLTGTGSAPVTLPRAVELRHGCGGWYEHRQDGDLDETGKPSH